MPEEKDIEEIAFKFLLKEKLTEDERLQFDRWLSEDKDNYRLLGQMKIAVASDFEREKEKAKSVIWTFLVKERQLQNGKENLTHRKFSGLSQFLRIAAVLVLVSLLGFYSQNLITEPDPVVVTERFIEKVALPGQKITTVLPDGTKVKLNAGSRLIAPENFNGESREVTLIGEAFFEVTRDETKPFQVTVEDGLKVTVLGTTFLVNASDSEEHIVAVKSGKVSVEKQTEDEPIILKKDEFVSVSESTGLSKMPIENSDMFFGWIDNKLVFGGADFSEVVSTVSLWFGYEIEVKLDASNFDQYNASLTNPGLKEVMESLSHSYKFVYRIDEKNKIIIIE